MSSSKEACILKLYVAGKKRTSMRAIKTLNSILERDVRGIYTLKVIDVMKNPQLAEEDNICATPTLVKHRPLPALRFIGDFSNTENVLLGLGCFSC